MSIHHRRVTCRLCESPELELVVPLAPIPVAEKYLEAPQPESPAERYPMDLYMCHGCGHVQILDVIDPAVLWADYTYHSGQTQGIVDHFEDVARQVVERYAPGPDSLAIDVGSNDGTLLRGFQRRGMRVLGVDPAVEIARRATEAGVETLPELLTPELARQLREERGPATVVTAFNVFAHADDMAGMLEGISTLLGPDGVFIFEVSYLLDIVDRMLLGTIFHEHLCHHSVKPMIRFLERFGLEMIDVERVSIQGGSFIGAAQQRGGPRSISPSVAELVALEDERRLDQPETLRAFSQRLSNLEAQVAELVAGWREQGATIAGFGAARSGPTLIAQFRLSDVIEYVFDDHPQKVGLYTPGDQLEVLPTRELLERQPDYVFILAWIHARKIIAANQEYLRRGGHFVVCCPEVEVIGAEQAAKA